MLFALFLKKFMELMEPSTSFISASPYSLTFLYLLNSAGVVLFTLSSVHWSERIVATRRSRWVLKFRAILALGYSFSRMSKTFFAFSARAIVNQKVLSTT